MFLISSSGFSQAGTGDNSFLPASGRLKKNAEQPKRLRFQTVPPHLEYNSIRCILKDHKGYMWFGSADGLIRYDGVNIYVYQHSPDDPHSISHNTINSLAEDGDGNLWIGTYMGLNRYNRQMDDFERMGEKNPDLERLSRNFISDLQSDQGTLLWIGTYGDGLHMYDTRQATLLNIPFNIGDTGDANPADVTSIAIESAGKIWVGTDRGLCLYSVPENELVQFVYDPDDPSTLGSNHIRDLAIDSRGDLWIGTVESGLNKLIRENGRYSFRRFRHTMAAGSLSNNYILSLSSDPKGYLWIGTENGGLNRLGIDREQFEVYKVEEGNPFSITSNSIWSLYHDDEDRLWIGTANRGINVIDEYFSKFGSFRKNIFQTNTLPDNDVTGFAEDSRGKVWIATGGGGICRFDPEKEVFDLVIQNTELASPLSNNEIQVIFCDTEDKLWVGTWAGGIDLLDRSGSLVRNYTLGSEPGAAAKHILTISADSKDQIWAGTSGSGLYRYDGQADRFVAVSSDLPNSVLNSSAYVTCFLEDSKGRFWVGTLNGLVILDSIHQARPKITEIISVDRSGDLNNKMFETIFEDSRGRLWFGTSNTGLMLFNEEDSSFSVFHKKDGLPGTSVLGILEDLRGALWITTNQGLCRFDYDSLQFVRYNREDGLNSNELYPRSFIKTRDGLFYCGGEEGFNVFHPEMIGRNPHIPPVYFSNLKISNTEVRIGGKNSPLTKHISETQELILNHEQSSFTIEFVALNYTRSAQNQFRYKLEGFDEKWNDAGTTRSATYTNLKPGKYTFLVKGSNNDGIWNPEPARLYIEIKPPRWKTWWAIALYILAILIIISITLYAWNGRIKIRHQLRLEKLAREREHELNENNIQFFTNISHEFRTPLSLIIGPLESLILSTRSRVKEQLTVIYRNAQRLLHLTNDLMDFRKLEEGVSKLKVKRGDILDFVRSVSSYFNNNAQRRNITYRIDTKESVIHTWFDQEKLETILLNLLSNAFKHTAEGGEVVIRIRRIDIHEVMELFPDTLPANTREQLKYILIAVQDNGSGITPVDLPKIFDKFYQTDSTSLKKASGTGIGLTLTKGLVALHHGLIKAESVPHFQTVFTFVLPVDEAAYHEDELLHEPADIVGETIPIIPAEEGMDEETKENLMVAPDEKPEVLIVEDNDDLRTFLVRELQSVFSIRAAENGRDGLSLATEHVPDLIVSDIVMPHMSGIELCKTVKSDVRTCHIPVILLTAKTTIHDQIEGMELGADAYITKPFNIQFLYTTINQMIQSRRKLYAHFSQDVYMMPQKLADNETDKQFLLSVIDFIHENISDNKLSVETLAAEMHVSRSNIYRKIKALTGKTVIEFIRIVRLKHALKLMESKKYSLAEIAYLCGFTSPSYFTKSFRDQYGKPPSDYLG